MGCCVLCADDVEDVLSGLLCANDVEDVLSGLLCAVCCVLMIYS